MANNEDEFKVCGLCTRLVDDSVLLNETLQGFMLEFLALNEDDMPAKVCTDCYHAAFTAMKFKESCVKAIDKLKTTKISHEIILGKGDSPVSKTSSSNEKNPSPKPQNKSQKTPQAEKQIKISSPSPTRSRRSAASSESPAPIQTRRTRKSLSTTEPKESSTENTMPQNSTPSVAQTQSTPATTRKRASTSATRHAVNSEAMDKITIPTPTSHESVPQKRGRGRPRKKSRSLIALPQTKQFSIVMSVEDKNIADEARQVGGVYVFNSRKRKANTMIAPSPKPTQTADDQPSPAKATRKRGSLTRKSSQSPSKPSFSTNVDAPVANKNTSMVDMSPVVAIKSLPSINKTPFPSRPSRSKTAPMANKKTPTVSKSTPTAPKSTPRASKSTPTAPKSTPTAPKSTPTGPKSTPAASKSTPVGGKLTPTTSKSTAIESKPAATTSRSVPTANTAAPLATKSVPTATKTVPTATKTVPTPSNSTPIATKSTPTASKGMTVASKSAPSVAKPAPTETKSASTASKSAPMATKSAPCATKSAPTATKSAPIATKSAPTATKSAPMSNKPTHQASNSTPTSSQPQTPEPPPERSESPEAPTPPPVPTSSVPSKTNSENVDSKASRSSFGRALTKPKKGNAFVSIDEISIWKQSVSGSHALAKKKTPAKATEQQAKTSAPLTEEASSSKTSSATAIKNSEAPSEPPHSKTVETPESSKTVERKAGPKSKTKTSGTTASVTSSSTGLSKSYYYVNQSGNEEEGLVKVEGSNIDDDEEIFPSIGPYQCEICQAITDTKKEFVAHIKKLHRNIVDEDVLKSLEEDLKKSNRKAKLQKMAEKQQNHYPQQEEFQDQQCKRRVKPVTTKTEADPQKNDDITEPNDVAMKEASMNSRAGNDIKAHSPDSTTPNGSKSNKMTVFNESSSHAEIAIGLDGEVFDEEVDEEVANVANASTNEFMNGIENSYVAADSTIQRTAIAQENGKKRQVQLSWSDVPGATQLPPSKIPDFSSTEQFLLGVEQSKSVDRHKDQMLSTPPPQQFMDESHIEEGALDDFHSQPSDPMFFD